MTVSTKSPKPARTTGQVPIGGAEGQELLDLYIAELGRMPVLSAGAQKDLARRMRTSTLSPRERSDARAELINANLRFAFSIAKKYQHRGLPLEDLVGEANAGLCRAADKYDPGVGVNFISYAVWWIRQALHASITTKGRTVRLPLGRAGDLSKVVKAQAALRLALRREPTNDRDRHRLQPFRGHRGKLARTRSARTLARRSARRIQRRRRPLAHAGERDSLR